MKNSFDLLIGGIVAIGMVTAFGIHSKELAKLAGSTGTTGSGVIRTVEKG